MGEFIDNVIFFLIEWGVRLFLIVVAVGIAALLIFGATAVVHAWRSAEADDLMPTPTPTPSPWTKIDPWNQYTTIQGDGFFCVIWEGYEQIGAMTCDFN